jgi:hypothetical protein
MVAHSTGRDWNWLMTTAQQKRRAMYTISQ